MKNYREIKRIIKDDLGFRDIAAYRKWAEDVWPSTRPTPETIARLSPEEVDNCAFWEVCDELFGSDPVCNMALAPEVGALPYPIETTMDANRMNLRLAKSFGITAFLEEHAQARLKVFEAGPGYGSLKHFVETQTNHLYYGVDAVPRISGVMRAAKEGLAPRDFVASMHGQFSYFVATNVFQHLSRRQRLGYVADATTMLRKGGLLLFNLTVDTSKLPPQSRDAEGNAWAVHYGQYTPIPKPAEAYDMVNADFDVLYVTQRFDSILNFACLRR